MDSYSVINLWVSGNDMNSLQNFKQAISWIIQTKILKLTEVLISANILKPT